MGRVARKKKYLIWGSGIFKPDTRGAVRGHNLHSYSRMRIWVLPVYTELSRIYCITELLRNHVPCTQRRTWPPVFSFELLCSLHIQYSLKNQRIFDAVHTSARTHIYICTWKYKHTHDHRSTRCGEYIAIIHYPSFPQFPWLTRRPGNFGHRVVIGEHLNRQNR